MLKLIRMSYRSRLTRLKLDLSYFLSISFDEYDSLVMRNVQKHTHTHICLQFIKQSLNFTFIKNSTRVFAHPLLDTVLHNFSLTI